MSPKRELCIPLCASLSTCSPVMCTNSSWFRGTGWWSRCDRSLVGSVSAGFSALLTAGAKPSIRHTIFYTHTHTFSWSFRKAGRRDNISLRLNTDRLHGTSWSRLIEAIQVLHTSLFMLDIISFVRHHYFWLHESTDGGKGSQAKHGGRSGWSGFCPWCWTAVLRVCVSGYVCVVKHSCLSPD